jgi:hypothetical protein
MLPASAGSPSLIVGVMTASTASAGNETREVWQAFWEDGECMLVLKYDSADMAGTVKRQNPCGGLLRKVKSFVYTDGSRSQLILFSGKNATGAMLGNFDSAGSGEMEGLVGDGEYAELYMSESSSSSTSSIVTININTGSSGDCIEYAEGNGCAEKGDMRNPKIQFGSKISMVSLINQQIFPFSGGKGFAKDETAGEFQCMEVKKCETAFNSSEDWCEVVLSDGFFTGWVKRADDNYIYLAKGC